MREHRKIIKSEQTHNRSFSAALPLPGFCRSFTSQQVPPLQPNQMIERLALGGERNGGFRRGWSR